MLSLSSSSSRILLRCCRLSGATTTTTNTTAVAAAKRAASPQRLPAAATLLQVRGLGAAAGGGSGGGGVPVPRSSQAKLFAGHPTNEGWESTVFFYYTVSAILLIGILGFAPDTTISSWAKQEATARLHLKERGIVQEFEFGKHYQDLLENEAQAGMDKFSAKAMSISEDDDDDEDEEEEAGEGGGGGDDDDNDEDEE